MVMPSGHEDDVVGFDRQFGAVDGREAFAADDIKEFIGLAMDMHTCGCPRGHRVPKQLNVLCTTSRTGFDDRLSFTWQTLAVARFQHTAALLRPR